jgi:uncharacterized protein (UPF0548 family)
MPMSLVVSEQAGHNLSAPGGIERLAEAVARGAACNTDLVLDVPFFSTPTNRWRKFVHGLISHRRARRF